LERAPRDTSVQILAVVIAGFLAGDEQHVPLLRHGQLILVKARHRHGDTVIVLTHLCNVVGRPIVELFDAACRLECVDKSVEADARPEQRRKVECCSHSHILLEATWVQDAGIRPAHRSRWWRPAPLIWGSSRTISRGSPAAGTIVISRCYIVSMQLESLSNDLGRDRFHTW